MKINVILVSKTKDVDISEYMKRISPYAKLDVRVVKEFDVSRIQKLDGYTVLLDERGNQMTSMEFSKFLGRFKDSGETLNFIAGGPYGFGDKEREAVDMVLSFSKMTFPHNLFRLFLLEQIYRGLSILAGKEYHNE